RPPQFSRRNRFGPLPQLRISRFFPPLGPQITVIELIHLERKPAPNINASGHMSDPHPRLRYSFPDVVPHLPRYRSVQPADPIAERGQPQRQNGHAEIFQLVLRMRAPESQKLRTRDLQALQVSFKVMI